MNTNLLASQATSYIVLGVFVVLLVAYFVWSSKSMKKREEERRKTVDEGMRVGTEILTIGGIKGTIVEISKDGESFVIETGTEDKKSYVKFDKIAFHSVVGKEEEVFDEPEEIEETEDTTENKD